MRIHRPHNRGSRCRATARRPCSPKELQGVSPERASLCKPIRGTALVSQPATREVAMATLQIELEDMAGTSWWAGVLATLASQSGNAYMRFVGRVNGHRRPRGHVPGAANPRHAAAAGGVGTRDDQESSGSPSRDRERRMGGGRPGYRPLGDQVRRFRIRLARRPAMLALFRLRHASRIGAGELAEEPPPWYP